MNGTSRISRCVLFRSAAVYKGVKKEQREQLLLVTLADMSQPRSCNLVAIQI
jgi:hypothetical protein